MLFSSTLQYSCNTAATQERCLDVWCCGKTNHKYLKVKGLDKTLVAKKRQNSVFSLLIVSTRSFQGGAKHTQAHTYTHIHTSIDTDTDTDTDTQTHTDTHRHTKTYTQTDTHRRTHTS